MKIIQEKSTTWIENNGSYNKFKVESEGGELKTIEIYKCGDYHELDSMEKQELIKALVVIISEHLNISCGDYLTH